MVRTYVVVRHSGQNWYWGILKRRLLGVQLARPQTSGQRGEKKCRPYLTMATLFTHWTILMAYNVKITEYVNGQLEVITYKQGVYTMLDGESSYLL
jgi:hypothetical protein